MATKKTVHHAIYHVVLGLASVLLVFIAIVAHIKSDGQGCGTPILGHYTPVEFVIVTFAAIAALFLGLSTLFLSREKQKMILFQSALIAFGIGLGMVPAETYLRLSEPKSIAESIYAPHDIMGRTYRPNSTVQGHFVDSRGFLIHQPNHDNPPQDARRVLILGDSFVAGIEVTGKDNMSVVLQSALNNDLAPEKYHVLNRGMQGIEPARYRVIFREVGLDYQPDYVVVVVFVLNDFFEDAKLYDEGRIEYDDSGTWYAFYPILIKKIILFGQLKQDFSASLYKRIQTSLTFAWRDSLGINSYYRFVQPGKNKGVQQVILHGKPPMQMTSGGAIL